MLFFARAAFISMVTSSTEWVAKECGEILELICTKLGADDWRLKTLVATLERMRMLHIASFKCVSDLLEKLRSEKTSTYLTRLSEQPVKIRGVPVTAENVDMLGKIIRLAGFFNPVLDRIVESTHDANKWMTEQAPDSNESYLHEGDLLDKILLGAKKKDFRKKYFSADKAADGKTEIWFKTCADLASSKYKCPNSFLIQCIEEHAISGAAVASVSLETDESTAALIDLLVYRSVISSLAKVIRSKIPVPANSAHLLKQNEASIMALAAELLEALNNNLLKLNYFLSKLSTVSVDGMWRILPALYNSKLDYHRLNIRDDDYEIEIQVEDIMANISVELNKKPRLRRSLELHLRSPLRQGYSLDHFLDFSSSNIPQQIQAVLRLAAYQIPNTFETDKETDTYDTNAIISLLDAMPKSGNNFTSFSTSTVPLTGMKL